MEAMNEQEIQQVREYAKRVAELLEGIPVPSIEQPCESEEPPVSAYGLDRTSRTAQKLRYAYDEALRPFKVAYRAKISDLLERDWDLIAGILEDRKPGMLARLDRHRQVILDHTDPAKDHVYWLESSGQEFGPIDKLKNKIASLEKALREEAERAERALNEAKPDPEKLDRKPTGAGQVEETTGEIGDGKERGVAIEHPWNGKDSDYMGASEAVQMAEKLNRRISLPTLSRLVRKPDCPIRFMRKSNGVRVHIADFKAHLETRPKIQPTGEDISDEALDEYMAHVQANKAAMRHRKPGTEPED